MKKNNIDSFKKRMEQKNEFDGNLVFGAEKYHKKSNRTGKGKPATDGHIREFSKVITIGDDKFKVIPDKWEVVSKCPVCSSKKNIFFLERTAMKIFRCSVCDHRFLNPRIKFDELIDMYSDDKTSADIHTSEIEINLNKIQFQYVINIMRNLGLKSSDKILDIGCGNGLLLETAYSNGFKDCTGIDVNNNYDNISKDCNKEGVKYFNMTFESISSENGLDSNYGCIVMWSVLEHIYNIKSMVKSVYDSLSTGGMFIVLVPNSLSLATRIIREKSPTYNWKHVSYFTIDSLNFLMEDSGFKHVFQETIVTEIDNVKSYMCGESPYEGYGDPEDLFSFIDPEYIYKNNLGSRILSVFKKI